MSNFAQTASANKQMLTLGKLKRLVGSEPSQSRWEGTPMLVPDYIAISVLIVLVLWAGVKRFPLPDPPRDHATE